MAYDKEELYKTALAVMDEHQPVFVEDIISYLPCSKDTFYKHFPKKSDEMDDLKRRLEINRVKVKGQLRNKMLNSKNVAAWIALYRLIGNKKDRRALSQRHIDHKLSNHKEQPLFPAIKGIKFDECECKSK